MSSLLKEFSNTQVAWELVDNKTLKQRSLTKPVLFVIGYSGCPHTQALVKTLENDKQLCELISQHFTSYLVDKYLLPQVDEYCQDFHLKLTQTAGAWPLIVLLEPEQMMPFFSTVAFAESLDLNLTEQLNSICQIIEQDKRMMMQTALSLQEKFRQETERSKTTARALDRELSEILDDFNQQLLEQADLQWGGLKSLPKFPHPTLHHTLLNILILHRPETAEILYQHLMRTLQSLIRTGIYDHLDGGFFRFCHDQHWQHPHFEKSLMDNAKLVSFLCDVARFNKDATIAAAAYETISWVLTTERIEDGELFPATINETNSIDCSSQYLINKADAKNLLSPEEWSIAELAFGFDKSPMLPELWHVQCWFDAGAIANKLQLPEKQVQYLIEPIKIKLRDFRRKQLKLQITDTCSISTNARILIALLKIGQLKNDEQLINSAFKIDERLGNYIEHSFKEATNTNLCLENLVNFIEAQITLLQYSWSDKKLNRIIKLVDFIIEHYWDSSKEFKTDNYNYPWSSKLIGYDQNHDNPLALFFVQLTILSALVPGNKQYKQCLDSIKLSLQYFFDEYKLKASSAVNAILVSRKPVIILFGGQIDTLDWFNQLLDKQLKFTLFQVPLNSTVASHYTVASACALTIDSEQTRILKSKTELVSYVKNYGYLS